MKLIVVSAEASESRRLSTVWAGAAVIVSGNAWAVSIAVVTESASTVIEPESEADFPHDIKSMGIVSRDKIVCRIRNNECGVGIIERLIL